MQFCFCRRIRSGNLKGDLPEEIAFFQSSASWCNIAVSFELKLEGSWFHKGTSEIS